jgi:hypothetical protein
LNKQLTIFLAALCFVLLALLVRSATPTQVMAGAAPYTALSDKDLRASQTYLLVQMAAVAGANTPILVLSNAAAFNGLDDHSLSACQTYLLSQLSSLLIPSNTLASIPIIPTGGVYLWNSNGVLYSINSNPSGTLTTNKLAP